MELKQRNNFSNNIKYLRKSNGLSQKELADFLHIKLKKILDFEKGEALPRLTVAFLISELFEVKVDDLFNKELMYMG